MSLRTIAGLGVGVAVASGAYKMGCVSRICHARGLSGGVREEDVRATLDAIEKWTRQKNHVHDAERSFEKHWILLEAYDWERKPRMHSCDARKAISVGQGRYQANLDGQTDEVVLIKFFDSEQKMRNSTWDDHPCVWGLAASVAELSEVAHGALQNGVTLIHREPQDGSMGTGDSYAEAHWVVEGGEVRGVRCVVKVSQWEQAKEREVRFRATGAIFKKEDVPVPPPKPLTNVTNCHLPADVIEGVEAKAPSGGSEVLREPRCEGESPLTIRCEGVATIENKGSSSKPEAWQKVTTPKLCVTNPTDNKVGVTKFHLEYQTADGEFKAFSDKEGRPATTIGMPRVGYRGQTRMEWGSKVSTFEVKGHETAEVCLQGQQFLGEVAPYCYSMADRVHHALGATEPTVCRAVFEDDSGKTKNLTFDVASPPVQHTYKTYDDAVEALGLNEEGLGKDYVCHLWMAVENPTSLARSYIVVSSARNDPDKWFVRVNTDDRPLPRSVNYLYPSTLERAAYDACKEGKTEVELPLSLETAKVFALVDTASKRVFGLRGEIVVPEAKRSQSCFLDYSRMVPESD